MKAAEAYALEVMRGKTGVVPMLLRGVLSVLSWVYNVGLEIYLLPYNVGIRKRTRLPCPVICVGNLTTGGTGKTPTTQTLCRLLQAQGRRVTVLNRGYGGQNEYGCAIVSDGKTVLLQAEQAGDEAFLLASTLPGVPVVVGKDRRITGKLAYEQFRPDVIVLDDGMQFWQLHRDLDIVLLNAAMPFDNGWTLPRGLLREPSHHLRRAGIVLLTHVARTESAVLTQTEAKAKQLAPNTPVFRGDLAPVELKSLTEGEACPTQWLEGRRIALLSAIGNPAGFASLLRALGAEIVREFVFRDHQAVTREEWESACREAQEAGAGGMVTTEKDAVKFPGADCDLPIFALSVRMQIENETQFVQKVLSVL
jgi:tetraacyldisaccharide 4'-kinase